MWRVLSLGSLLISCGSGSAFKASLTSTRSDELVGHWTEADLWNGVELEYGSRGQYERLILDLYPDGMAQLVTIFYDGRAQEGPRCETGRWGSQHDELMLQIYVAGDSTYWFRREASHLWLRSDDGSLFLLDYGFLPLEFEAHPPELVGAWQEVGAHTGGPNLKLVFAADGTAERYQADLPFGRLRWSANGERLTIRSEQPFVETWKYSIVSGWLVLSEASSGPIYLRSAERD